MFKTISILLVACFLQGAVSQLITKGNCDSVPQLQNFNISQIGGHWYTAVRYPDQSSLLNNSRCVQAILTVNEDDVKVEGFGINLETGVVSKPVFDSKYTGFNSLFIPFADILPQNIKNTYILAIDPKNYASVYACFSLLGYKIDLAIIFIKNLDISKELLDKAIAAYEVVGLYRDTFTPYINTNCPLFV